MKNGKGGLLKRFAIVPALVLAAFSVAANSATPSQGMVIARNQVLSKQKMETELRDPESAKYQEVYAHSFGDSAYVFCGRVNAKNGFGGYTGVERFVAASTVVALERSMIAFNEIWQMYCTGPGTPVAW